MNWSGAAILQNEQLITPTRQVVNPASWVGAVKLRPAFQFGLSNYRTSLNNYYTYLYSPPDTVVLPVLIDSTTVDTVQQLFGNGQIAFKFGILAFNLGYFQSQLKDEDITNAQELSFRHPLLTRSREIHKLWSAGVAMNLMPGLSVGLNYNSQHYDVTTETRNAYDGDPDWHPGTEESADFETYDAGIVISQFGFGISYWVTGLGNDYILHGKAADMEAGESVKLQQVHNATLNIPLFTNRFVWGNHVQWQTAEDSIYAVSDYYPAKRIAGQLTSTLNLAITDQFTLTGLYQLRYKSTEYENDDLFSDYPVLTLYSNTTPQLDLTQSAGGSVSFPLRKYQFWVFGVWQQKLSNLRTLSSASPTIYNLVDFEKSYTATIWGLQVAANF